MPFRVIVVDDEAIARRRITRLVREEPDAVVVAECANGIEAVDAIREHRPDLVFLDVQMPGMDGFEVMAALGDAILPPVVFVTAYDAYALRAFEVHATDYVLKPFEPERFRAAFDRARRLRDEAASADAGRRLRALLAQLAADESTASPPGSEPQGRAVLSSGSTDTRGRSYVDRVMVKSDGRVIFVRTAEIDWLESAGNYVRLHVGRTEHMIRETLAAMESALDPSVFARIHRRVIVNLDRVRELQPWFTGDYVVILKDGTQLRLSRTYWEPLAARMRPGGSAGPDRPSDAGPAERVDD